MRKRPDLYIADMVQYGRRIVRYMSGVDPAAFRDDQMLQDAVIRNFIVVGEAATQVPREFREAHPGIPWSSLVGFRNVLVHQYPRLREDEILHAAHHGLPTVLPMLESILREHGIDPDRVPE